MIDTSVMKELINCLYYRSENALIGISALNAKETNIPLPENSYFKKIVLAVKSFIEKSDRFQLLFCVC